MALYDGDVGAYTTPDGRVVFTVFKEYSFAAAHAIRGHTRGCQNLHGHNYRVRVLVASETLDPLGMARAIWVGYIRRGEGRRRHGAERNIDVRGAGQSPRHRGDGRPGALASLQSGRDDDNAACADDHQGCDIDRSDQHDWDLSR